MHDIAALDAFVILAQPSVDPETFEADELLLFLCQNLRQLIQREINLHHVLTRIGAALGLSAAGLFADSVALLAIADTYAARIITIAKMRELDAAHGDGDQVLAFFADQFALGEK